MRYGEPMNKKSSVPTIKMPEPIGYVLEDLYCDLSEIVKKYPKATVHIVVGSTGGPMPQVVGIHFYKSGIKGRPSFILETEKPK